MMGQPEHNHVVYLIGSGCTDWQEQDRLQGDTDLAMSRAGMEQIHEQARLWMETRGEAAVRTVYSAPDQASRDTAAIFAERAGAKVKAVPELAEMHLGLWQGLTVGELRERYRSTFHQWQTDFATSAVPQGELPGEAERRLRRAVKRLARGQDALVLTLRPMMLRLATALLTQDPHSRRLAQSLPPVQRFDLDDQAWRALRSSHGRRIPA